MIVLSKNYLINPGSISFNIKNMKTIVAPGNFFK